MTSSSTIMDVAKAAGYAKSTVSRVLNNSSSLSVSKETRAKIINAAKDLNYVPTASARALTNRRTYQIGFLLYARVTLSLANEYFGACMSGAHDKCEKLGYRLMVSSFHRDTLDEFLLPSNVRDRSVDGVIIAGAAETSVLKAIEGAGIPLVQIGEPCEPALQDKFVLVRQDSRGEFYSLLQYAAELGHSRIGMPGARPEVWEKYISVIEEFKGNTGIEIKADRFEFEHHDCYENMFDRGYANAGEFAQMSQEERPTLFFAPDQWCYAFLKGLKEQGVDCPRDVSVVASSDVPHCRWTSPSLTAFKCDPEGFGTLAAEILIKMLDDGLTIEEAKLQARNIYRVNELVIRESTSSIKS